jgi:hypothetical protein
MAPLRCVLAIVIRKMDKEETCEKAKFSPPAAFLGGRAGHGDGMIRAYLLGKLWI